MKPHFFPFFQLLYFVQHLNGIRKMNKIEEYV